LGREFGPGDFVGRPLVLLLHAPSGHDLALATLGAFRDNQEARLREAYNQQIGGEYRSGRPTIA
jgi:hypothetical protein